MGLYAAGRYQLPLEVQLRDDATLDNFLPLPSTEAVLADLRKLATPEGEPVIFLWGGAGTGKTHLLQACCHQQGGQSVYLPLADLGTCSPGDVLQGVEELKLVCLDDLQAVLGREDWEIALFNLYNSARESGCRLLVAADAAPRELPLKLEDLRSRLSWGMVFRMQDASDEEKAGILSFRARRRGLALADEVAVYIAHRAPRDMEALISLLDRLDRVSLAEKRALSIPFVKSVLGW